MIHIITNKSLDKNEKCPYTAVLARSAKAGLPIIPILPKPIIPPKPIYPIPQPVVPKPVEPVAPPVQPKPVDPAPAPEPPKPVDPAPAPPKPVDPAPQPPRPQDPKPDDASEICKRAGGDPVSGSKCPFPISDADILLFRDKGARDLSALEQVQKGPSPKDKTIDFPGANYQWEQNLQKPDFESDEIQFLLDGKIKAPNPTTITDWTSSQIRNPQHINDAPDRWILESAQSVQEKFLVIRESRGQQFDKAPEGQRAAWSDMTMHTWKQACSGRISPDSLKYILRENILAGDSAKRTRMLIDNAIQRVNGNPAQVNVFRSGTTGTTVLADERMAFEILAGSDHVNRVLRMLADYPQTMKNVRIESLSVTTSATETADNAYNILIKLTKVESP